MIKWKVLQLFGTDGLNPGNPWDPWFLYMSRPDIYHIVDSRVRTHTLCGIEMGWDDPRPLDYETWCNKCLELDG